ncbi:MAG: sulfotransferase [Ectothiorhodospiraceae bacterium]|nr:sulfotransferase [Ectothiorhodospiraceae bacterium]
MLPLASSVVTAEGSAPVPRQLLIHIGYPKTGSTWLQQVIFDSGRYGLLPWGTDGSEQRARNLWFADRLELDVEGLREAYCARLQPSLPADAWMALSSEGFSGSLFSGGHNSAWNADVLHALFPHARILVVVREQRSIILSAYGQYVKKGGLLRLEALLAGSRNKKIPFFDLRQFEYHRLIAYYQGLFGSDRVLVLPYEWIGSDPLRFIASLHGFLGIEVAVADPGKQVLNRAHDAVSLAVMRRLNYLRRADPLNGYSPLATTLGRRLIDGLCGCLHGPLFEPLSGRIRQRWQRRIAATVAGRYAESNRRLAALSGLPLEELGYDCGSAPQNPSDSGK